MRRYPHTVHHHQPRPRPAQHRRQRDRPSRPEEADLLPRRLRPVRAAEGRSRRIADEGEGEERGRAQASAELHRPLQGQGHQGAPGAEPRQGAGADGNGRGRDRGSRAGLHLSRAGEAARLADRRHQRRRRRLRAGQADPEADSTCASTTTTASRCSAPTATASRPSPSSSPARLRAESGEVQTAPGLKIGFFAQHQLDDLVPTQSAVEHVRRPMPDAPEAKVRARVAQMGLATEKMDTPAKDLSGGEKARLLMGLAAFDAPNLLILDEPTNHLDIDSRRALIEALNDYRRRRHPDLARPPPDRSDRRPAVAGQGRHGDELRRRPGGIPRPDRRRPGKPKEDEGAQPSGRRRPPRPTSARPNADSARLAGAAQEEDQRNRIA